MPKQTYFEDVEVGSSLPKLVKKVTSRQLVKWAGASGDFYEIHYDQDFARSTGLPGIITHGRLKSAFLGQLVSDLAGEQGWVKKLSASYRGMDFPGQDHTITGKVTKKYTSGDENIIECDLWLENPKGEKTTLGAGVVALPSKAKK